MKYGAQRTCGGEGSKKEVTGRRGVSKCLSRESEEKRQETTVMSRRTLRPFIRRVPPGSTGKNKLGKVREKEVGKSPSSRVVNHMEKKEGAAVASIRKRGQWLLGSLSGERDRFERGDEKKEKETKNEPQVLSPQGGL